MLSTFRCVFRDGFVVDYTDVGQIAEAFHVVQAVADDKFVGDIEANIVGLQFTLARHVFAQKDANFDAQGLCFGHEFVLNGMQRVTAVENVIKQQNMPAVYLGDLIEERAETTERRYTFLTEHEIEALPPINYLVDKVLPLGGYGLIYGRRGSGKTFDALDLALSITTGRHYHGLETHASGSTVAYIMSECAAGLRKRIAAWKQARLVTSVPGFHALPVAVPLNDPIALAELCLAIEALPSTPSLLVIDTLARSASGLDENSSQDMTRFISIMFGPV